MKKKEKISPEFSQKGLIERMERADSVETAKIATRGGQILLGVAGGTMVTLPALVKISGLAEVAMETNPAFNQTATGMCIAGVAALGGVALLQKLKNNQKEDVKELVGEVKAIAEKLKEEGQLDLNKMTGDQHKMLEEQLDYADYLTNG